MVQGISNQSVTGFGKNVQKKQTKSPEPPAGSKSQGAAHANENSAVARRNSQSIAAENVAGNNTIPSPIVQEQVAAVNEAIENLEVTDTSKLNGAAIAGAVANMAEESVQELQSKISNDLLQSQAIRVEQAKKNSILNRETTPELQAVMAENGITSTGNLKNDIEAIKTTIAGLDKETAKALRNKFKAFGVSMAAPDKDEVTKASFRDLNQLAFMNKQLLVKKKAV